MNETLEPGRVMSFTEHPMWDMLSPYLFVSREPGKRARIELRGVKGTEAEKMLPLVTMTCARCGTPIQPVRQRKAGGRGGYSSYYFSPACSNAQNPGCSRGTDVSIEIETITHKLYEEKGREAFL